MSLSLELQLLGRELASSGTSKASYHHNRHLTHVTLHHERACSCVLGVRHLRGRAVSRAGDRPEVSMRTAMCDFNFTFGVCIRDGPKIIA